MFAACSNYVYNTCLGDTHQASYSQLILVKYYIFVLTQCPTLVDYSTVQVMGLLIADNHW